ncbi:hypothetical protein P3X46_018040 [Hevea brasiliensis]|uniref:Non-specific lipid-transfer protein n=1 Tax=Hevea brasiliensis TaxID=3981 RepID=A0ABQ9LQS8_HEVBR|nr:non-specific lipid-transfer protein 1-like [Hevea brasiliensis]KAJ9169893.1 hypothetical protein P3X46_018040 [Hevea brasiliensis]
MEGKMKVMMGLWGFGLLFFLVMFSSGKTVHGITCSEAVAALQPCFSFLSGTDQLPNAPCCMAVQAVNKEATTKEIRKQLCECFKQAGPAAGVKPEKAKKIPDLCHVQVPVPIDPSIDFSK